MTPDAARRFFDAIADRYDRAYAPASPESRQRMRRILPELPTPPASVLDLGVGTGRELPALLDAGYAPTGLDVSIEMLDRCRRRARPVPLVQADFWQPPLPFPDASFDAAVALHGTLAHPPERDAVARLGRELARVVRSAGVFVAEVPNPSWLDSLLDLPPLSDRRLLRNGPRTCLYEDLVVGAAIEARILDEGEWRDALAPGWAVRIESLERVEWLIVAHRV
jgi:SAM-dependent methyltransferase